MGHYRFVSDEEFDAWVGGSCSSGRGIRPPLRHGPVSPSQLLEGEDVVLESTSRAPARSARLSSSGAHPARAALDVDSSGGCDPGNRDRGRACPAPGQGRVGARQQDLVDLVSERRRRGGPGGARCYSSVRLPGTQEGAATHDRGQDRRAARTGRLEVHLVILAAKRAREINSCYNQLGEGRAEFVRRSWSRGLRNKPLSIALEEIAEGKIIAERTRGVGLSAATTPWGARDAREGCCSASPAASPRTRPGARRPADARAPPFVSS